LKKLDSQLASSDLTDDFKRELQTATTKREQALLPFYSTVAVHFADLHDTPGRMLAKEVISDIVTWKKCRPFFFWRLQRRLKEFRIMDQMAAISPATPRNELKALLSTWLADAPTDEAACAQLEDEPPQLPRWAAQARRVTLGATLAGFGSMDALGVSSAVAGLGDWAEDLDRSNQQALATQLIELAQSLQAGAGGKGRSPPLGVDTGSPSDGVPPSFSPIEGGASAAAAGRVSGGGAEGFAAHRARVFKGTAGPIGGERRQA